MGWRQVQTPSAQLFDLPLIGDDLAKVGRIINIHSNPCSPTAEIWVYAFWQAIPTLFITLTKPELIDIDIKKGSHRPRKGRRAKFRASALFRDSLITIPVPSWRVFKIYEWTQRIGWYFLVADALEDFTINWLSLAYKYNGCETDFLCYANYHNDDVLEGSSSTPSSRRFVWNAVSQSNCSISSTECTPGIGGNFDVTWNCTFRDYQVPSESEQPYSTHLLIDDVVSSVGEGGGNQDGNKSFSGNSRVFIFDNPPAPTFKIAGSWINANKACYMTGDWSISRVEDNELSPDP